MLIARAFFLNGTILTGELLTSITMDDWAETRLKSSVIRQLSLSDDPMALPVATRRTGGAAMYKMM